MIENCEIGKNVMIHHSQLSNIYRCKIGDGCVIGPMVEIQQGAVIGKNAKICSHSFIASGVEIGDSVFIGHGVIFVDDLYPIVGGKYRQKKALIDHRVSIGSGSTILPVIIGMGSIIGAGSVVVRDVPELCICVGNPAHIIHQFRSLKERDEYIEEREREI